MIVLQRATFVLFLLSIIKSALLYQVFVVSRPSASCIALVVDCQTDHMIEPLGWQVQNIARLQNNFIDTDFTKVWKHGQVRCRPIDS